MRNCALRFAPRGAPRNDDGGDVALAFSRHDASEFCSKLVPPETRGRRECRARAAPAVSYAKGVVARMSIQAQRRRPASPAQWFTAYSALSPVIGFVLPPSRRTLRRSTRSGWTITADLAPATGARTTRLCRTHRNSFVLRAFESLTRFNPPCDRHARRRSRVHHIPSRVRDDHDTPLWNDGRRGMSARSYRSFPGQTRSDLYLCRDAG